MNNFDGYIVYIPATVYGLSSNLSYNSFSGDI
jgi:hypothetical protein